jgi:chromosomal replication initiation ATPase DnaA
LQQSSFDFPFLDHYLDDDFLTSKENLKAFNFVSDYTKSNNDLPKAFAVYGKKHSGKSHLAHVWERSMNAEILKLDDLEDFEVASQIEDGKAYIIEDVDTLDNQVVLFHAFNIALEKGCFLMLTSSVTLSEIKYDFADLESRLKNVFAIKIDEPEIDLVKMLLVKSFAAKQLMVEDKVIDFLAKNIDRSYEKIGRASKLLEFYCFEQKRKITVSLVNEVLSQI